MRIKVLCAVLLAALLGGCISSDKPLFPKAGLAAPLEAGLYMGGKTDDEDAMPDQVVVQKFGASNYLATTTSWTEEDGKKVQKVTKRSVQFYPLDKTHFVAQVQEVQKTASRYEYFFVFAVGETLKFYVSKCHFFQKAPRILKAYDLDWQTKTYFAHCGANTFEGLVAFMREMPLVVDDFTTLEYTLRPKIKN